MLYWAAIAFALSLVAYLLGAGVAAWYALIAAGVLFVVALGLLLVRSAPNGGPPAV